MRMKKATLLTIITERIMEPTLRALVERAGALGYTVEDVSRGWGTHGARKGILESDQTFKMLTVVPESVAKEILNEVERVFEPDYAVLAFQHDIEVMTGAAKPKK